MLRVARVMLARDRRDAGDVSLAAVMTIVVAAFFIAFVMQTAMALTSLSHRAQRESLAEEAADIAIAQAMYELNEGQYALVDPGTSGTYDRSLPNADSPATANMDSFNATKLTSFHEVDADGKYGIRSEARWWVDVFDVEHVDGKDVADQNRIRQSGMVGDLVVEARVVNADGLIYGYRGVKIPLYQMHARAVQASRNTDGGLSYIVSPLSLFQFSVFGTESVRDAGDSAVKAWSPFATSGDVDMDNPSASFSLSADQQRRYDSNVYLFGGGNCWDHSDASHPTKCSTERTLNTGFEIEPDTELVERMQDFCASQGSETFRASEYVSASLTAGETTYCFRDFFMDADVQLVSVSARQNQVVRIFVDRHLEISDGAKFKLPGGQALGTDPAHEMQVAIYTLSDSVTLESRTDGAQNQQKFYLYAPEATCSPGEGGTERGSEHYMGSLVCKNVVTSFAQEFTNHPPFAELTDFGTAGFGTDLYPNNLWFINQQSTEFIPRNDEEWDTP